MPSWDEGLDFRQLVKADPEVASRLSPEELADIFDYGYYLRYVDETFQRVGLAAQKVGAGQAVEEQR